MLYYWTRRYFFTLLVGLAIVGFLSVMWLRQVTIKDQLALTKLLAQEISAKVVSEDGQIMLFPDLPGMMRDRQKYFKLNEHLHIVLKDAQGQLLFPFRDMMMSFPKDIQALVDIKLPSETKVIQHTFPNLGNSYVVISPILYGGKIIGGVLIIQQKRELSWMNEQDAGLLVILLISLALLGWYVIYRMFKRLTGPILQVANAAKELQKGNYDIKITGAVKEKEIHELLVSFKDMAARLKQLEMLRTELLAGVTHELKTPIASISALLQAVKDDVVSEEEQAEFLDISFKETLKLQNMVKDLLDFNSFASSSVKVNIERLELNTLVKEIAYQWQIVHETEEVLVNTHIPDNKLYASGDVLRIQQILINLLNNSLHAVGNQGTIQITLYERDDNFLAVDVEDDGIGIPLNEQDLVFERFYRGSNKKHKIRGLGLGLPFSLLLARAMQGDLVLKASSETGTVFTLTLPK